MVALMVEDSMEDEQVAERTTGCALSEPLHYPEVELALEYDYGEGCYQIPWPALLDIVRGELPESRKSDVPR